MSNVRDFSHAFEWIFDLRLGEFVKNSVVSQQVMVGWCLYLPLCQRGIAYHMVYRWHKRGDWGVMCQVDLSPLGAGVEVFLLMRWLSWLLWSLWNEGAEKLTFSGVGAKFMVVPAIWKTVWRSWSRGSTQTRSRAKRRSSTKTRLARPWHFIFISFREGGPSAKVGFQGARHLKIQ